MKTYQATGKIIRIWPEKKYKHGAFRTRIFSVSVGEGEIYYFKVMGYGKSSNMDLIKNNQTDDVVKLDFKISCQTTSSGYPSTDLLVISLKTLSDDGQQLMKRRKEAIRKKKER